MAQVFGALFRDKITNSRNGLMSTLINDHLRQNIAARMIPGFRKHDRITPVLKELHWLPVSEQIQLKKPVLTYKSLNGRAPSHSAELIHENSTTRLSDDRVNCQ